MGSWCFLHQDKTCCCWQGSARPRSSASLQNSLHKRADRTVYDGISKTRVLLQIEVQSSPICGRLWSSPFMVMLTCCAFSVTMMWILTSFIVLHFRSVVKKSAMKITVIWKNLHFNYHLKVLTTASRIWVDRRVVENQQVKVPSLPNPDSVNNECTKAAILTFWKIVLEIPDTVTTPFVFCWNLEFTRVKPSRVFILFCGICETLELDMHQSSF